MSREVFKFVEHIEKHVVFSSWCFFMKVRMVLGGLGIGRANTRSTFLSIRRLQSSSLWILSSITVCPQLPQYILFGFYLYLLYATSTNCFSCVLHFLRPWRICQLTMKKPENMNNDRSQTNNRKSSIVNWEIV